MKLINKENLIILGSILLFIFSCENTNEKKAKEIFYEQQISDLDRINLNEFYVYSLPFVVSVDSLIKKLGKPQKVREISDDTKQYMYTFNKSLSYIVINDTAKINNVNFLFPNTRVFYNNLFFSNKTTFNEMAQLFPNSYQQLLVESTEVMEVQDTIAEAHSHHEIDQLQNEKVIKVLAKASSDKIQILYFFFFEDKLQKIELHTL